MSKLNGDAFGKYFIDVEGVKVLILHSRISLDEFLELDIPCGECIVSSMCISSDRMVHDEEYKYIFGFKICDNALMHIRNYFTIWKGDGFK